MRRIRYGTVAALSLALAAPTAAERVESVFDGADPSALFVGDEMWIYPTGRGDRLIAWSSSDRTHWKPRGTLIRQQDIAWIKDDHAPHHSLWAPDMVRANGHYYLYYSVGPQDPTPSRIGVAIGDTPAGPFIDSGKPLLTGGNGFEAIDPKAFIDPGSGKRYLYAGGSNGATLRVFALARDMVTIAHEVQVDQPPGFTEGVFMHERRGVYYLSYSSGHWNRSNYKVRYATAPSPIGPWIDRGVILSADARYKGPGHHAFVRDPRDGSWLIVYHRWEGQSGDGPYKGSRKVAIQHIHYDAHGLIAPISMEDGKLR